VGRKRNPVPSYLHHKPSGQAYCRVGLTTVYLGAYNSPESRAEYARVVGRLPAPAPPPPRGGLTVAELLDRFRAHAEAYYRDADGRPTSQVGALRYGLRAVGELYADLPADEFGQPHVKAVRQVWIDRGNARGTVNARLGMVRQLFAWAADEELVDAATAARVKAVRPLQRHRTPARETEPVKPAPAGDAEKVIAALKRPAYRAMLRLQLLTGMRPGEVCRLRPGDIDRTQTPWRAEFRRHKTSHRGRSRVVYFGPRAREVLAPYLDRDPGKYCFAPRDWARQARAPHVTVRVYWHRVDEACAAAGVPPFGPNRLRHTKATEVRDEYGLEGAQHVLDHSHIRTTELYAERSEELKRRIAEETG
jgi:integrase